MNERETATDKVLWHYLHAVEKHPHFADAVDYVWNRMHARHELLGQRRLLKEQGEAGCVTARAVLDCELAEVYEAYHRGRYGDAVEECFDAIAVLIRMADMIRAEAAENQARGGKGKGGAE